MFQAFQKTKKSTVPEVDITDVLKELLHLLNKYTNVSVIEFRNLDFFDDFDMDTEVDKGSRMISIKIDLKQISMG